MRTLRTAFIAFLLTVAFTADSHADAYWLFLDGSHSPGEAVDQACVETVGAVSGVTVRTVSRYFNALSVEYAGDAAALSEIDGVRHVQPVAAMGTDKLSSYAGEGITAISSKAALDHRLSYGISYPHLSALNIPAVHDMGYTGSGVVIGVLDAGFNAAESGCLTGVHILDKHNFITGSSDISGDNHGTHVLSLLAAKEEGAYYGASFGASYILAVTDDAATETRADEDRWVAAIEWCDELSADIIVSSLVYNIFDTAQESYAKDDMDGQTSLVAQAAEIAWERGMIVVNSVGNEGANSWGIVTTPADAEHVIAVGAVQQDWQGSYVLSAFSSRGPTADGRIKPDFVAPGVLKTPEPGSTADFIQLSGTSLSAPLVGGILALMLEANPNRDNATNVRLLRLSANDMGDAGPDNSFGWGMIDAAIAATLEDMPTVITEETTLLPDPPVTLDTSPNPFNASLSIDFELTHATDVSLDVFAVSGQRVDSILDRTRFPAGRHSVTWHAGGMPSGIYFIRLSSLAGRSTKKALLLK